MRGALPTYAVVKSPQVSATAIRALPRCPPFMSANAAARGRATSETRERELLLERREHVIRPRLTQLGRVVVTSRHRDRGAADGLHRALRHGFGQVLEPTLDEQRELVRRRLAVQQGPERPRAHLRIGPPGVGELADRVPGMELAWNIEGRCSVLERMRETGIPSFAMAYAVIVALLLLGALVG